VTSFSQWTSEKLTWCGEYGYYTYAYGKNTWFFYKKHRIWM